MRLKLMAHKPTQAFAVSSVIKPKDFLHQVGLSEVLSVLMKKCDWRTLANGGVRRLGGFRACKTGGNSNGKLQSKTRSRKRKWRACLRYKLGY
jgi:hypothetical protein